MAIIIFKILSDAYRRYILTSKDNPRAERVRMSAPSTVECHLVEILIKSIFPLPRPGLNIGIKL